METMFAVFLNFPICIGAIMKSVQCFGGNRLARLDPPTIVTGPGWPGNVFEKNSLNVVIGLK